MDTSLDNFSLEYLSVEPREINENLPPVLLIFHGYGATENDLMPIAEMLPPSLKILSFRGPIQLGWGGFAWYHLIQRGGRLMPEPKSRWQSEGLLRASLADILSKERIDRRRVFLMGFSQGAAVCYDLLSDNELGARGFIIKGVAALSGYVTDEARMQLMHMDFQRLPVFMAHGEQDDLIPPEAMDDASALLSSRGAIVTAKRYKMSHSVEDDTIEDLNSWFESVLED